MRRKVGLFLLAGALAYTGAYIFIYLARAFQTERPRDFELVGLHHADDMSRTILVTLLFLMGEIFVLYLALAGRRPRSVSMRHDLWDWLRAREELTGESADDIAERAVAHYRMRLEGGPEGPPSAGA